MEDSKPSVIFAPQDSLILLAFHDFRGDNDAIPNSDMAEIMLSANSLLESKGKPFLPWEWKQLPDGGRAKVTEHFVETEDANENDSLEKPELGCLFFYWRYSAKFVLDKNNDYNISEEELSDFIKIFAGMQTGMKKGLLEVFKLSDTNGNAVLDLKEFSILLDTQMPALTPLFGSCRPTVPTPL